MWRKFTVYGLRFSKTSFWNRMNTGFLDPAVATVLTACGIETSSTSKFWQAKQSLLQQCLPLAVLKLCIRSLYKEWVSIYVATVLTACGIETRLESFCFLCLFTALQQCLPLAVLKPVINSTVHISTFYCCNSAYRLRYWNDVNILKAINLIVSQLQQCLPLAVLKPTTAITVTITFLSCNSAYRLRYWNCVSFCSVNLFHFFVATVLTACGIETIPFIHICIKIFDRCNSAYRLRYWNES